jgi:hypothetical protein
MVGVGGYLAFQEQTRGGAGEPTMETSLYRVTVGTNWPIAKSMDVEGSVGISQVTAVGLDTSGGLSTQQEYAHNDYGIDADVRLFSALTTLNGDFVPHVGVSRLKLEFDKSVYWDVAVGVGLNVNIDKGFFWAGLEWLYEQKEHDAGVDTTAIGGRVSFGIERNIVWDWFVARVGVMKKIMYLTEDADRASWMQNDEYDADDDLVGFGIGLNIENRLKFDILVAEDVAYTLTNLFGGPLHHVFTRIDATFCF